MGKCYHVLLCRYLGNGGAVALSGGLPQDIARSLGASGAWKVAKTADTTSGKARAVYYILGVLVKVELA